MRLRINSVLDRLRSSLFFVPMAGVLVALLAGAGTIVLDSRFDGDGSNLPLGFASTVDSARAVLSTIAGATITFAGIAFSVSLLIIQLASSQYSPRVVHSLFRDPFNKRVMALVVGTFTYCVVVLRSVRSALVEGGQPVIPNISVAVAVFLGIATILAIVAFINHSAHSMDVSQILNAVTEEALDHVRREWSKAERASQPRTPIPAVGTPSAVVEFERNGWVQQVDLDALLKRIPEGVTAHLDTVPGRYAIRETKFATLSPVSEVSEQLADSIRATVFTGPTRTMQQDVSYGLRQLADVALKALSPGINDPTTAQDAIFHGAAVLGELLHRDPPAAVVEGPGGRRVAVTQGHDHATLVRLLFDEVCGAAAAQPAVCVYILESLHLLAESVSREGLADRRAPLVDQAFRTLEHAEHADLTTSDRNLVREAFDHRFAKFANP